jgi:hypothetical protein
MFASSFFNFTIESINFFFTIIFLFSIWSPFFYITNFLGTFVKLIFFFSISSSDIGLVVNWESWSSLIGLHRAQDQGNELEKLTRVILVFFILRYFVFYFFFMFF